MGELRRLFGLFLLERRQQLAHLILFGLVGRRENLRNILLVLLRLSTSRRVEVVGDQPVQVGAVFAHFPFFPDQLWLENLVARLLIVKVALASRGNKKGPLKFFIYHFDLTVPVWNEGRLSLCQGILDLLRNNSAIRRKICDGRQLVSVEPRRRRNTLLGSCEYVGHF